MDVFKNLYPDQDVPEGMFSFDSVFQTFDKNWIWSYWLQICLYMYVFVVAQISAVLLKSVLWIDSMQIHSLQLPVVKFVLYCTFCNFVIHDLVISYSWPWKYGLMRLLAWREMMMMMTMKMTTKLQLFLDIKILAVTPTLPSAENNYWVGF